MYALRLQLSPMLQWCQGPLGKCLLSNICKIHSQPACVLQTFSPLGKYLLSNTCTIHSYTTCILQMLQWSRGPSALWRTHGWALRTGSCAWKPQPKSRYVCMYVCMRHIRSYACMHEMRWDKMHGWAPKTGSCAWKPHPRRRYVCMYVYMQETNRHARIYACMHETHQHTHIHTHTHTILITSAIHYVFICVYVCVQRPVTPMEPVDDPEVVAPWSNTYIHIHIHIHIHTIFITSAIH
jgi:hypothetical protein